MGTPRHSPGDDGSTTLESAVSAGVVPGYLVTVDVTAVLDGLDAIFAAREGTTRAGLYLRSALADAERLGDDGAQLTFLNELAGLYRSQSLHDDAVTSARAALALADRMGIDGTDAHATTLVNAATALGAAGEHEGALALYRRALASAESTMPPADRRLAALHNNLSIVLSRTGDPSGARDELLAAVSILQTSSPDPDRDLDVATSSTNLALVCFSLGASDEAAEHLDRATAIFRAGGHERDPHYSSTLAGCAEGFYRAGRFADAVALYREALDVVSECYGVGSDAYQVTAANLAEAEDAAHATAGETGGALTRQTPVLQTESPIQTLPRDPVDHGPTEPSPSGAHVAGLSLAREYWETYGRPLLEERYPAYLGRIAAGLVGHGSECYGFDDAVSRDHDTGPGFCLWLTADDHAEIGAALQADYDALPRTFRGVARSVETPRAQGDRRRVGVFEIGDFYEEITGLRRAPGTVHEWLMLDEATLAAATNGAVFADPHGAFSAVRGSFTRMPRDVRWTLVSRRLGMIAQAGQYNLPRMLDRGEVEAAWLSAAELARAVASLVFLLTGPSSAGYLPYYKWHVAALRRLSRRMGSSLPGAADHLSDIVRLTSSACFGADAATRSSARVRLDETIESLCAQIVDELRARGLTRSTETFLERQREHVAEHITDPWLASL